MLRTNSKKYLSNIQNYLIGAVNTEDYTYLKTVIPAEKIAFVMSCYDLEFNHKFNQARYPNDQQRFANWLAGLPSAISIPFYDRDIIDLAKTLQNVESYTKRQEEVIINNYFNHIAYHILKLNNKLN